MANNTTKKRKNQAVKAQIDGLRQYAEVLLRETKGGRFNEDTMRLLFDLGRHALRTSCEIRAVLPDIDGPLVPESNGVQAADLLAALGW